MISGDYEWTPNLWNDRDKPFWGDDELETSSNDFDIIPKKRQYRCVNCTTRAHINKRYCSHCVKILKNKPTRALRQKIKKTSNFTKIKRHIRYINKPNNQKTVTSRKRIKYVLNPIYSNLPCVCKENIPSTDSDFDIETERHIERMQRRAHMKANTQEELSCELSFDFKSPIDTETSSETKLYSQALCIVCDKRPHKMVVLHSNGKHHGFCGECALRFLKSNEECAVCNHHVTGVISV